MKKLLTLQLAIAFCMHFTGIYAQDSIKNSKPAPHAIVKYRPPVKIDPQHPPITKLVQNVRYTYFRDKTDAQVAAMMYADKASYNKILDRIYNDYDAKKGIPRWEFNRDIVVKYGDPFPSPKPAPLLPAVKTAQQPPASKLAVAPPPQKPVADTGKTAVVKPVYAPDDKSLNSQYQYLLTRVYAYQQPLVSAFHKIMMDTLLQARAVIKTQQNKMALQSKMIDSLQNASKTAGQTLSESNTKSDEISLLGIPMAKSTYNIIMWGLVISCALIAVIVISRSGAYNREAKYRSQLYTELEEEYKNYKLKANEKEKKLARELQTERNKLDDLLGRS